MAHTAMVSTALVVLEDQHERGSGELFALQVGGRLGEVRRISQAVTTTKAESQKVRASPS